MIDIKEMAYLKLKKARENYANLIKKARYEVADADAMLVYSVMETYIKKLDSARMEIIKYEGMVEAFKMMDENE